MKSIWHVQADTAEDFRQEILKWLHSQLNQPPSLIARPYPSAPNKRQIHGNYIAKTTIEQIISFLEDLNIDPKEPKGEPE